MQDGGVAKQIARWGALGALFLIPLTPLMVSGAFFFPFITGKAFYFRTLAEIAFVAWVLLALLDRSYRPRFSWIGASVVAFVVWMFVADLFAINVLKAFWSNFERMEGWVLLAHLLGFFFAASNVLRVEKKWRTWFLTSLGVSAVVSGYALLQLAGAFEIHQGSTRIDASFGNSGYLAVYLLFNVFIALWIALTENRTWLTWSLIALATLDGVLIFFTETRGSIVGLVVASFLALVLTALTAGTRVRRSAMGGLLLLAIVVGGIYVARDSEIVQGNRVLRRVTSISLADLQTRRTIWGMALQGVAERPVVGWGQEGFNYVFNKYYEPSLFGQESWFDRAHNAYMDWLTAGGVPALLLYISLFGTAISLLWRRSELSRPERITLTAVLVGYGVNNVVVFDNLYSYIYFFVILALIDSQVGRTTSLDTKSEVTPADGVTLALPIAVVVLGSIIWLVNISGLQAAHALAVAGRGSSDGVFASITVFQDLLTPPGFAAQEIREQLIAFTAPVVQSTSVSDADKQQLASLAITEMQKQVEAYPKDARERLQLAYAYRIVGATKEALREVLAAAALSPRKQEMWIEAGATAWDLGDMKSAREYFHKAYALGPQFPILATYAAAGDIAVGELAAADKILIAAYSTTNVIEGDVLPAAYYRTKNWPRLIAFWKARAELPGADAQAWFSLAAAYYTAGDPATAIATIRKTMQLFPAAAESGEAAIKQIQAGPAK